MSGDFPPTYFPSDYFPASYFGGGSSSVIVVNISASLSGGSALVADLATQTRIDTHDLPAWLRKKLKYNRRRLEAALIAADAEKVADLAALRQTILEAAGRAPAKVIAPKVKEILPRIAANDDDEEAILLLIA